MHLGGVPSASLFPRFVVLQPCSKVDWVHFFLEQHKGDQLLRACHGSPDTRPLKNKSASLPSSSYHFVREFHATLINPALIIRVRFYWFESLLERLPGVQGVNRGWVARLFTESKCTGIEFLIWGRVDWTPCDARCSVVACKSARHIVQGCFFESEGTHVLHNSHCFRRQTSLEMPAGKIVYISCGCAKGHAAFRHSSTSHSH